MVYSRQRHIKTVGGCVLTSFPKDAEGNVEGKIRPVAPIRLPAHLFPWSILPGLGTQNPPLTGAERRRPDCVTDPRCGGTVLNVPGCFKRDATDTTADKMAEGKRLAEKLLPSMSASPATTRTEETATASPTKSKSSPSIAKTVESPNTRFIKMTAFPARISTVPAFKKCLPTLRAVLWKQ